MINYVRGSEWRKWDLHIHSPLSLLNNQYRKLDTHSTEYTDGNGTAKFSRDPTGKVEVFVGGKSRVTVDVGQNNHEDVTVHL